VEYYAKYKNIGQKFLSRRNQNVKLARIGIILNFHLEMQAAYDCFLLSKIYKKKLQNFFHSFGIK
jgi:hypothetical protein